MDSEKPFLYLILSGQSKSGNKLQLAINAPFKQRIAVKYIMQGLKPEELPDYISTRLKSLQVYMKIYLLQAAIEAIYSASKGTHALLTVLQLQALCMPVQ